MRNPLQTKFTWFAEHCGQRSKFVIRHDSYQLFDRNIYISISLFTSLTIIFTKMLHDVKLWQPYDISILPSIRSNFDWWVYTDRKSDVDLESWLRSIFQFSDWMFTLWSIFKIVTKKVSFSFLFNINSHFCYSFVRYYRKHLTGVFLSLLFTVWHGLNSSH